MTDYDALIKIIELAHDLESSADDDIREFAEMIHADAQDIITQLGLTPGDEPEAGPEHQLELTDEELS